MRWMTWRAMSACSCLCQAHLAGRLFGPCVARGRFCLGVLFLLFLPEALDGARLRGSAVALERRRRHARPRRGGAAMLASEDESDVYVTARRRPQRRECYGGGGACLVTDDVNLRESQRTSSAG